MTVPTALRRDGRAWRDLRLPGTTYARLIRGLRVVPGTWAARRDGAVVATGRRLAEVVSGVRGMGPDDRRR